MYVVLVTISILETDLSLSPQALSTGRPPTFNRDYIDCKFPQEDDLPSTFDAGDSSSRIYLVSCALFYSC
jgi:hypothetical protein